MSGLIEGECGSIVFDQATEKIYGHVVGSDDAGCAFVIPLLRILHQIKASFPENHIALCQFGCEEQKELPATRSRLRKLIRRRLRKSSPPDEDLNFY